MHYELYFRKKSTEKNFSDLNVHSNDQRMFPTTCCVIIVLRAKSIWKWVGVAGVTGHRDDGQVSKKLGL
jgi:hypothetical protein